MDNSIYDFKFTNIDNVGIKSISNNIGLTAPYSVAPANNRLYFVSRDGVYSLTTVQYSTAGVNTKLVSENITPLLLNKDYVIPNNAVGYNRGSNYYLVIPDMELLDDQGNEYSTSRQFKLYTDANNPC